MNPLLWGKKCKLGGDTARASWAAVHAQTWRGWRGWRESTGGGFLSRRTAGQEGKNAECPAMGSGMDREGSKATGG